MACTAQHSTLLSFSEGGYYSVTHLFLCILYFQVTTATALMGKRVDEQMIMHRTGHSSTTAVRMYKRPDAGYEREISTILQPPMPKVPCLSEVSSISTSTSISSEAQAPVVARTQQPSASTSTSVSTATTSSTVSRQPSVSTSSGSSIIVSDSSDRLTITIKKGDKEVKIDM